MRGNRALAVCGSILILVMMVGTIRRNRDWHSAVTLWDATVKSSPMKIRPRINLARAYQEAGRDDEAIAAYQDAVTLSDRADMSKENRILAHQLAAMNTSQILIKRQQWDAAEAVLVHVWNEEPGFPGVAANLGVVYISVGRIRMAREVLEVGIEAAPGYPWFRDIGKLYLLKGETYEIDGRCDLAEKDYAVAAKEDIETRLSPVHCKKH